MVTFRKMILLYDGQTYIHQKHLTHATCILYNNTKITITGVQHLNKEKIAAGPIKPVFFCQILQITCCMCCMFMI